MSPELLPIPTDSSRSVLCPRCGYDLRAATGGRCSECGLEVDLASLARSTVPWAHRREIGRMRAFLKTLWQITADSKTLRHEAAKPQAESDAARFRWVVTLLLLLCTGGLAVILIRGGAIEELVWMKPTPFETAFMKGYEQDLAVPWSAGVALRWAWAAYAVLAAVVLASAPGGVFRTRGMPDEQAQATRAVGAYCCAPLVLLVPATLALVSLLWIMADRGERLRPLSRIEVGLSLAMYTCAVLAVVLTVHRTGQWRARVMRAGYPTGFLAMGELLLRWILGGAFVVFFVPWCVGFLWIFIDSLRP